MEAALNVLQLPEPEAFVKAAGEANSVKNFVEEAFKVVNHYPEKYVVSDKKFFHPTSNYILKGSISKARKAFSYDPKVKFSELVKLMVEADLKLVDKKKS
jgi:GDPmannose 4,6-dehydratase